ncbi:MAG: hypothetical protein SPI30_05855 [Prevotella sp.]|nr:hypothetical protein [Prevotella sp.]
MMSKWIVGFTKAQRATPSNNDRKNACKRTKAGVKQHHEPEEATP